MSSGPFSIRKTVWQKPKALIKMSRTLTKSNNVGIFFINNWFLFIQLNNSNLSVMGETIGMSKGISMLETCKTMFGKTLLNCL
jgi:hypothetical protein